MISSIIRILRKIYTKYIEIENMCEKEMEEWVHEDPETFALFMHFFYFDREGDISG